MELKAGIDLSSKIDPQELFMSEQHKTRYVNLFGLKKTIDQTINHAVKALKGHEVEIEETVSWFEFKPTPLTKVPALIHSISGDIKVEADRDGVIRIQYNPKLAEENPWVTFPSDGNWKMQTKAKKEGSRIK